MRYSCIDRHRDQYPVRMMCQALKVSRSGYYAWRMRPESRRAQTDRALTGMIRRLHAESNGVYGSPKIRADLAAEGYCVGRHKVARLMRSAGLRGCPQRRFKRTTKADPSHPVAENILQQDFTAESRDQRWAADITYRSTQCRLARFLYGFCGISEAGKTAVDDFEASCRTAPLVSRGSLTSTK